MNLRIQKPSGLGLHPGKSLLGVVGDATRRRDLEHQLQRKDDDDDGKEDYHDHANDYFHRHAPLQNCHPQKIVCGKLVKIPTITVGRNISVAI